MLKRVITKVHAIMLRKRYRMNPGGASLLEGVFRHDYILHKSHVLKVYQIHHHGFAWDDWHVSNLTRKNCTEYLRTVDYYAMHPLNNQYSHWIDDKLTLKYLCAGTSLDKYMPKYFYQIDEEGNVLALSDAPDKKNNWCTIEDIIFLLEESGELAMKRIAGSLGEGFYKAVYKDGKYRLNSKVYSKEELIKKISELKDYLITEYFHPHQDLVPFCEDTVNCIRYLVGRDDNGEMKMIKSFIRLGTKASGFVENYNAGGVLCYVSEVGEFYQGNLLDVKTGKNKITVQHPDTKVVLQGTIPCWDEIQHVAQLFGSTFPQTNYLGIDFVVTDKYGVKVLEINSLTSLDSLQLDTSILKTPQGQFFKRHMKNI